MKKMSRRIIAVILTVVMTVSRITPVYAADMASDVSGDASGYHIEILNDLTSAESDPFSEEVPELYDEELLSGNAVTEEIADVISDESGLVSDNKCADVISDEPALVSDNKCYEVLDDRPDNEYEFPGLDKQELYSFADIDDNKEELVEHLDELSNAKEGIDFVKNEIIVEAPDEKTALTYAKAFDGELLHFEYGYALIELNPSVSDNRVTVMDAVYASADPEVMLPAAWPNYIGQYCDGLTDSDPEDYDDGDVIDVEYVELEASPADEDETVDDTHMSDDLTEYSFEGVEPDEDDYPEPASGGDYSTIYNDPLLKPLSDNYQWQHYLMQSESAWRAGYTGKGVKITILDSGVNASHSDLTITNKGIYDYNNKKLTIGSVSDSNGHGTHCTGIAGAKKGNSVGGAGIAPDATMNVIGISGEGGGPDSYAVFLGINQAVNVWKTDIISMSLTIGLYPPQIISAVENAYKNGVAVFCASGNNSSNQLVYPAACKHAISVGAVDKGNKRAFFSNQNSKVRYSGPGVDIYSTYKDGSYYLMSGTSQATPAVAGAAAVILSSGRVAQTGSRKVDKLLTLMDKCCVKSGVGKGTPNLAEFFKTGSMTSKPSAPKASIASGVNANASFNVTLSAEEGTTIYYTTDNSKITYKKGVVSANAGSLGSNKGTISITGASKVVLQMVAINTANRMCSKVAKYTYKLQPKISSIALSAPNGIKAVQKGGSIQIMADITPAHAKNRSLKWELPGNPAGIKVNNAGKVTVANSVKVSSFTVMATSTDGSNKTAQITVNINTANPVDTIKASAGKTSVYNGETKTITITTRLKGDKKTVVSAATYTGWQSSDTTIATCSIANNTLSVKGVKAGNTTITGLARDGSGKKCVIKVTVLQKVTGIVITGYPELTAGKGNKPASVKISPDNASNKKLAWTIIGVPSSTSIKDCGVSVNKDSGMVKASVRAVPGKYTVQAMATDTSNVKGTYSFTVVSDPIKEISLSAKSLQLFRVNNGKGSPVSKSFSVILKGGKASNLTVINDSPGLVTAALSGTTVTVKATGNATGTANITVMSTDGTNKKKTVKVKVVNPATRLYLSLPPDRSHVLQYRKTLKLTPGFVAENGAIDKGAGKLKWTSSNTNYLTVNSKGVVKAVNKYGSSEAVRITASTTDGSNLTAVYDILPNGMVTRIRGTFSNGVCYIYAYGSGQMYNAYGFSISGPAAGLTGAMNGNYLYLYPNKKGIYTIKVFRNDGGGQKYTLRIRVT